MASNEQYIWNYLKSKGLNDYGVAGLMGNLYAESALNPKNLQQTYEKQLGYTDATYTESVDNGTYTNFVKDSAGYGLAQWTYWGRKQNLLNFARSAGKSIGDLDMQLDFLWNELNNGYCGVLEVIKNATSVLEASNEILLKFECPADQSISVQRNRANYGQVYYDKYANTKEEDVAISNSPLADNTSVSPNNRPIGNTTTVNPNSSTKTVRYRVQTGAFVIKANANKYLKQIHALGGVYKDAYINKDVFLYKIQVGYFSQRTNADTMVKDLKSKGISAYITIE